jgi:hypothetical protein
MNITLRLEGVPERIINDMIHAGIAATKTEAIRIALLDYVEHHPLENYQMSKKQEDSADKKIQWFGMKEYLEDEKEDEVWNKYLEEEKSG